ncbi:MAG: hypothetical protein AAGE99_01535 [Chlamydiota bacterium]
MQSISLEQSSPRLRLQVIGKPIYLPTDINEADGGGKDPDKAPRFSYSCRFSMNREFTTLQMKERRHGTVLPKVFEKNSNKKKNSVVKELSRSRAKRPASSVLLTEKFSSPHREAGLEEVLNHVLESK